jgi:hypothetical protein
MPKSKKPENRAKKPQDTKGFSESSQQDPLEGQPGRSKAYQAALEAVANFKPNGKHK